MTGDPPHPRDVLMSAVGLGLERVLGACFC